MFNQRVNLNMIALTDRSEAPVLYDERGVVVKNKAQRRHAPLQSHLSENVRPTRCA